MKKIFLTLAAIAVTSFASFADTSLKEAYNGLAKIPGMNETCYSSTATAGNITVTNAKAAVINVSGDDVQSLRDQFTWMTENLPVRQMVVGANNMREMAAVYATPAGNGKYNVLVLEGNALTGNFSALYGQTDAAGVKAFRNANVQMDAQQLSFTTTGAQPDTFISLEE